MTFKRHILAAALFLAPFACFAADDIPPGDYAHVTNGPQVLPNGSISETSAYNNGSAKGGSFTLSNSSAVYVAGGPRRTLVIDNPSSTINVACAFGQTAALNTGGSYMIPAGSTRTWPFVNGGFVPSDDIRCIAASGTPTITIQVN